MKMNGMFLFWFSVICACLGVMHWLFTSLSRKYVEVVRDNGILQTENALLAIKNEELRSALDEARDRLEAIDAEKERKTNDKKY